MNLENAQISSQGFLLSGLAAAMIDAAFVWFLARRVTMERFRQIKWPLAASAAIFWGVFSVILVRVFWDSYYRYFFPDWAQAGGILLYVPLVYGTLTMFFHWLTLRFPGNPILNFSLLAGLESLLEHFWGMAAFKILEIPLLRSASPASMLAFAFPEYILYWCVVICLALIFQDGWRWFAARQGDL